MPFYRSFQTAQNARVQRANNTQEPLNSQKLPEITGIFTTPVETETPIISMEPNPSGSFGSSDTSGDVAPQSLSAAPDASGFSNIPDPAGDAAPQNLPADPDTFRAQNGSMNPEAPEQPSLPENTRPAPEQNTSTRPLYPVDNSTESFGGLRINITNLSSHLPIEDAVIRISEDDQNTSQTMEELRTDSTGQTGVIELPAPPRSYSEESGSPRPYGKYTIDVTARGYEPFRITGTEVLPTVVALQSVQMLPMSSTMPDSEETFVISEHTLYGIYPPKIAEDEVKELSGSGEIVLSEVVIPEFVVVHDGTLNNKSAQNYYVRYRDYIKNVASSEIYATWPEATIYANILAIQSFTLNRVYTEWYRNRGYNFTITSSTAYDHKWIPNRNTFDTINTAVDNIFTNFLSRPNISQPILTQYCDGKRTTCPGLMSQWGSKYLGDEGYSAIEILRNYYGNSIFINTTEQISGVPSSYPGEPLSQGSRGEAVRQMQEQLNAIADVYYSIPNLAADGVFGPNTEASVRAFQKQFNLSDTGIVDFSTWYKISEIYVAITKIAEYTK